ncbi:MAG: GrpB family protein [Gemmatimonadaceae bacterium]
MSPIRLDPYDGLWPEEFEAEAARLERACRDLPLRLAHVGSTAVPGLTAKPVIDILAGVPPRANRAPYIAALVPLGYEHLGAYGIPGRDYFRRGNPRSHHVHMVSWSSKLWRDHLLFRDYLRAHPGEATEYAVLKRELAAAAVGDKRRYSEGKGPFIKSVLRRARRG